MFLLPLTCGRAFTSCCCLRQPRAGVKQHGWVRPTPFGFGLASNLGATRLVMSTPLTIPDWGDIPQFAFGRALTFACCRRASREDVQQTWIGPSCESTRCEAPCRQALLEKCTDRQSRSPVCACGMGERKVLRSPIPSKLTKYLGELRLPNLEEMAMKMSAEQGVAEQREPRHVASDPSM